MKNKKIFILHGWAYSTEKWERFVVGLRKEGLDPVMLNIPGLTAPLEEIWEIDNYVLWLEDVLKKEKEKVILLGHSNGGLIALSYAFKYPEKVKKIILMDSTGIYHKELSIRIKRFIFAAAARAGKKFTKSSIAKKLIYKLARAHDYEEANPIMKETMKNLIKVDRSDVLRNLKTETLIIWGGHDQVTPLKDGLRMNREINNSKLKIINAARHSPQITHPLETAKAVAEFI
jgi:pimeloyl-ACP methyl ester carboxylesterase